MMLDEWIRDQTLQLEREASNRRYTYLCKLPANTFQAIYDECFHVSDIDECSGARYNGVYYSEWEIYFAAHARDCDTEVLF